MLSLSSNIRSQWLALYKVLAIALMGLYLVNCLSPLRLHVDTLRYFAIKDCIELGCPPDSDAAKDYLPYGYTALLLLLSKLHILKSFTIILINCLYLFGSIYLIKKIFGASVPVYVLTALALLHWTTIKFTAHPLSEMQYLFFSINSLCFFYQYTQRRKIVSLLAAFGFGIAAFLTRSVGVTLFAALVAGLLWQYRTALIQLIKNNKILVVLIVLAAIGVVVFSKQLGLNHYTGVLNKQLQEGRRFSEVFQWHCTEWTEMSFNISEVKAAKYLPHGLEKFLFVAVGLACFIFFLWLLLRKNSIPFIIKAYLVFYCLLMFNWPFYDPRFWVPVWPLVIAVVIQSLPTIPMLLRRTFTAWTIIYALAGVAAVGYFTYTSLNKKLMVRTHANGVYRNEYETHYYGKPLSDTATKTDPVILHVLDRYD